MPRSTAASAMFRDVLSSPMTLDNGCNMAMGVPSFELAALARCRGGFTYCCKTGRHVGKGDGELRLRGFMVSLPGCETQVAADSCDLPGVIDGYVNCREDALGVGGNYLGGWVDGDVLFMDVSRNVATLAEALELGRQWGQLAVYDLDNGQCLRVPECVGCGG